MTFATVKIALEGLLELPISRTNHTVPPDETFEVTFKVKVKDDVSGELIKNKENVLEGNNN